MSQYWIERAQRAVDKAIAELEPYVEQKAEQGLTEMGWSQIERKLIYHPALEVFWAATIATPKECANKVCREQMQQWKKTYGVQPVAHQSALF